MSVLCLALVTRHSHIGADPPPVKILRLSSAWGRWALIPGKLGSCIETAYVNGSSEPPPLQAAVGEFYSNHRESLTTESRLHSGVGKACFGPKTTSLGSTNVR